MSRRPYARRLTQADQSIWASYTRQVAPLRGVVTPPELLTAPSDLVPSPPVPPPPRAAPPSLTPLEVGTAPGGVDRGTWTRFRTGKLTPVRTLDLHGFSVHRAHAELLGFLARAVAEQWRCVEVITGRGSGERGGAIRREFAHWLNVPSVRATILAASHPHPANSGAVRLLLRRAR